MSSGSARVEAKINPGGASTSYHVVYITAAKYEANLAASQPPFAGALRSPAVNEFNLGGGTATLTTPQVLFSLTPETGYVARFIAHNSQGTVESEPVLRFTTQANGGEILLPDSRGWEQVSPIEKNGGSVAAPGSLAAGGVYQAAANGESVAYGSTASFGAGGQGAPPVSQYLAARASGGWSTQNLSSPLFSGSFDFTNAGDPYQLFSADLASALILNGDHCRGEAGDCGVANPPLIGTDAPAGYQDYYLRTGANAALEALLGNANAGFLHLAPADFNLAFAGASSDLRHVVVSTCAKLSANATEVPAGAGCNEAETNLYEFSPGTGLSLVNVKPAQSQGTPGAKLGAQAMAVSSDGSRIYWSQGGDLYLRTAGSSVLVEAGAQFQTASGDGSVAFFTKGGHLYRYAAGSSIATDLTPAGEVLGVLGASTDGSYVYYQAATGLFLAHNATTTKVAAASDPGDYPPSTGTARVSADGTRLVFVSDARLTGYDNTDLNTGAVDSQIFLYNAGGAGTLVCVSCNPTNERPIGRSSIPGAVANGSAADAVASYKPRVISTDGARIVFDSADAIGLTDTDNANDVYQWEAQGEGSCTRAGGCVALLSSGRSSGGARLVDASSNGNDVFFVTDASLVAADAGAFDLYDARVGGGFAIPQEAIPCEGDACQPLPPVPVDPTLTTVLSGPGNPGVRYPTPHACKKGSHKHRGKCVKNAGKKSKAAKSHKRETRDR